MAAPMADERVTIHPPARHKSATAALAEARAEGLLDGVCLALDALHAAGYTDAYEAMFKKLFAPADGGKRADLVE